MNALVDALTHMPWWVYLLFIYLLKLGFNASKPTVISMKKLVILPAIFLFVSLDTLITSVQLSPLTIGTYLLSIVLGAILGWILVRHLVLQFDKKKWLIKLPGTWTTLILILIILSTKYYFGYALASDPTRAHDTIFELSSLAVSGLCTGLLLGRLLCYYIRMKNAPHEDLSGD